MTKFILALLVLASAGICVPARAQWVVSAGVEASLWKEDSSPIGVKETGPLFVVGLDGMQRKDNGLLLAYRGKIYYGDVNYDGAQLDSPGTPITGTTTCFGTLDEAQLRYRLPHDRSY